MSYFGIKNKKIRLWVGCDKHDFVLTFCSKALECAQGAGKELATRSHTPSAFPRECVAVSHSSLCRLTGARLTGRNPTLRGPPDTCAGYLPGLPALGLTAEGERVYSLQIGVLSPGEDRDC